MNKLCIGFLFLISTTVFPIAYAGNGVFTVKNVGISASSGNFWVSVNETMINPCVDGGDSLYMNDVYRFDLFNEGVEIKSADGETSENVNFGVGEKLYSLFLTALAADKRVTIAFSDNDCLSNRPALIFATVHD